jgi:hypothetical protein
MTQYDCFFFLSWVGFSSRRRQLMSVIVAQVAAELGLVFVSGQETVTWGGLLMLSLSDLLHLARRGSGTGGTDTECFPLASGGGGGGGIVSSGGDDSVSASKSSSSKPTN